MRPHRVVPIRKGPVARQHRWVVAMVTALFLAIGLPGCAGSSQTPPASSRTPIASPPDPGPLPTSDEFTADQRDRISASVVGISGIACGRMTRGSGFVVADELVATSAHVLLGLDSPSIATSTGERFEATPVAFDPTNDLALLFVPELDLEPLNFGTAQDGTVGAIFGWDSTEQVRITPFRIDRPVKVRIEGVASDRKVERPSWLLAADIERGDSGAAVVSSDGSVVGVVFATSTTPVTASYAVRVSELQVLLDQRSLAPVSVPSC
jgi:S1-C subfamily serine protease